MPTFRPLFSRLLENIAVFYDTRGGKGISIIIPTLLTNRDSIIVTDVKAETYEATAEYRASHLQQKVFAVDLSNLLSEDDNKSIWNPLDFVRWGTDQEYSDLINQASYLFPGDNGKENFWKDSAKILLVNAIQAYYKKHRKISYPDVYQEFSNASQSYFAAFFAKVGMTKAQQECEELADQTFTGISKHFSTGIAVFWR